RHCAVQLVVPVQVSVTVWRLPRQSDPLVAPSTLMDCVPPLVSVSWTVDLPVLTTVAHRSLLPTGSLKTVTAAWTARLTDPGPAPVRPPGASVRNLLPARAELAPRASTPTIRANPRAFMLHTSRLDRASGDTDRQTG